MKPQQSEDPPSLTSSSMKISILGLPGIGKSALVLRWCKSDFLSFYEPTIEEEYSGTNKVREARAL